MINIETKYELGDLSIIPAHISKISKADCNPYEFGGFLPLFASPMPSVVNDRNMHVFFENKINAILPRTFAYKTRLTYLKNGYWVAFSLDEFKKYFCDKSHAEHIGKDTVLKVCIDGEIGNEKSLYESVEEAKDLAYINQYNLLVMVGNIANPSTYKWICENARVDYVRIGIGAGHNSLEKTNCGTYYPMASLINECAEMKKDYELTKVYKKSKPFIIADGGIKNYDDVIKSLALGADYVMIGSLFSSFLESAAEIKSIEMIDNIRYPARFDNNTGNIYYFANYGASNYIQKSINIWGASIEDDKQEFLRSAKSIVKKISGMTTKEMQILVAANKENPEAIVPEKLETSRGTTNYVQCNCTISQWAKNMTDYLQYAMQHNDKKNLKEFKSGGVVLVRTTKQLKRG